MKGFICQAWKRADAPDRRLSSAAAKALLLTTQQVLPTESSQKSLNLHLNGPTLAARFGLPPRTVGF